MGERTKKIVVIGGGTGTFTVLCGLKKYSFVDLSAIVSMADDGGSTKILREEFGILPPGSVRPALVALSHSEKLVADLFNYRFSQGSLKGHNLGNLLITALTKMSGSFEKAINLAGRLLNIKGEVIPSTFTNACLFAQLENGKIIKGETNIDIPKHNGNLKIKKVWLEPSCQPNPQALKKISLAHLIIIGPGDLFSSIIPNLLVKGIPEAIKRSGAKKIFICNLMTKFGETTNFKGKDFVET
ncbi:YvcK family protein, partial [bacterium]|nr:YvcK family protein [bacterium]